jgi:hypothetical protein
MDRVEYCLVSSFGALALAARRRGKNLIDSGSYLFRVVVEERIVAFNGLSSPKSSTLIAS